MTLTVLLIPHLDAGDRTAWTQDQDKRPLSPLGRRQAEVIADALSSETLTALYSSPALRCMQSIEPLALAVAYRPRSSKRYARYRPAKVLSNSPHADAPPFSP